MRRLVLAATVAATMAIPADAYAHTLSFGVARGETYRWARTNAAAAQSYAWGVGACQRINGHVIDCAWWSKTAGRDGGATIHCDRIVRIRLGRFGIEREYPVVDCHVEGFPPA